MKTTSLLINQVGDISVRDSLYLNAHKVKAPPQLRICLFTMKETTGLCKVIDISQCRFPVNFKPFERAHEIWIFCLCLSHAFGLFLTNGIVQTKQATICQALC